MNIGHTSSEHAMALTQVDRLMKWRACVLSSVAWIGIDRQGCIGRAASRSAPSAVCRPFLCRSSSSWSRYAWIVGNNLDAMPCTRCTRRYDGTGSRSSGQTGRREREIVGCGGGGAEETRRPGSERHATSAHPACRTAFARRKQTSRTIKLTPKCLELRGAASCVELRRAASSCLFRSAPRLAKENESVAPPTSSLVVSYRARGLACSRGNAGATTTRPSSRDISRERGHGGAGNRVRVRVRSIKCTPMWLLARDSS
jgi:hypothetical protein